MFLYRNLRFTLVHREDICLFIHFFQVHAKPISIHAPMTRLLAGLSLFMEKFDLNLRTSHELDILEKPSTVELVKN